MIKKETTVNLGSYTREVIDTESIKNISAASIKIIETALS
jgi:hypothetical protein